MDEKEIKSWRPWPNIVQIVVGGGVYMLFLALVILVGVWMGWQDRYVSMQSTDSLDAAVTASAVGILGIFAGVLLWGVIKLLDKVLSPKKGNR